MALIVLVCYFKKKNNKINDGRVISQQPLQPSISVMHTSFIYNVHPSTLHDPSLPPYVPAQNKLSQSRNNNPKVNDFSNTAKTFQRKSDNNKQYPVLPQPFSRSQDPNYL